MAELTLLAKLPALNLARYRFTAVAETEMRLPEYPASALRGGFGRALREMTCITNADKCDGCSLVQRCSYPRVFESRHLTTQSVNTSAHMASLASYVIEPVLRTNNYLAKGERFAFDMVLIGQTLLNELPVIFAAWQRALKKGIGSKEGRAKLVQVEHLLPAETRIIYQAGDQRIAPHESTLNLPDFQPQTPVSLQLTTPLRLVQQRQTIGLAELSPAIFLRHLVRRVSGHLNGMVPNVLSLEQIQWLNQACDQVNTRECKLSWKDWTRYSSRQQQKMTLGGLMGSWSFEQVSPELYPIIYLGQWLHVGKETVFGLGWYQWLELAQHCKLAEKRIA